MAPLKVLLFTNLFPSSWEPSRGIFNLRRFKGMSQFCDIRVVAPVSFRKRIARPMEFFRPPSDRFERIEASYPTNWTVPRVLAPFHARDMFLSVRSHVRELRRRFPFDAIVGAFAYPDAVVAARLAKEFDCAFVALVMGSDINDLAQRPSLKNQIRGALRDARAVIALSGALKERVVELGVPEDRVFVQHNSVCGKEFAIRDRVAARKELGMDPEGQLACFIGNLAHEKGPDVLIEALVRMGARSKSLHVAFVGDGAMRAELEKRTRTLGLADKVTFTGRCRPERVPLWISASDVVCLPSRREGCPNVVLEALACGRPVVASAVGGVPELLSQSNGVLVAPDDPVAFGLALDTALQRAWNETGLRQSAPSLEWEDFGRSMHAILLQAMDRKKSTRSPQTH
jgi:glycosyltransferase involved in cell wall biosynthesis